MSGKDLQDEIDALYALPPEEFTAARNELAKRSGNADVRKLKRPSQAAGIVNRLTRTRRGDVERLVEAGRNLRQAQARGAGVEEAIGGERDALAALLNAARAQGATTDTVIGRVRGTFQAAAADDEAAARVLEARLEQELEPPGFGPLLAAAAAAGPRERKPDRTTPRAAERERERRERQAREERLREARRELREAEQEERAAEQALKQAQTRLKNARAALERASR